MLERLVVAVLDRAHRHGTGGNADPGPPLEATAAMCYREPRAERMG